MTARVFGIGLNKTGTVSLHEALTILGYNSLHWGGEEAYKAVARALREGSLLLTYIDDDYDAFSDIGSLTAAFDVADAQYPGSKFILTTRDLDSWLDSRRRHVEKNQVRKAHGDYDGNFLEVDIPAWVEEYREHHARVRSHFAGRSDHLLEIDITTDPEWEPICHFLGKRVPDEPFPWGNRYVPFPTPDQEAPVDAGPE